MKTKSWKDDKGKIVAQASTREQSPQILTSERGPGGSYDLYQTTPPIEIFVDGTTQIMVGTFVTKLMLHTLTSINPEGSNIVEKRRLAAVLSIPTVALLQTCTSALQLLATNRDALAAPAEQFVAHLRGMNVTFEPPSS